MVGPFIRRFQAHLEGVLVDRSTECPSFRVLLVMEQLVVSMDQPAWTYLLAGIHQALYRPFLARAKLQQVLERGAGHVDILPIESN